MVHWRYSPWLHVIASGFLPFSAIYIELHYVFLSVWGSKIYTLYGVLLTAFIMLLLVAGMAYSPIKLNQISRHCLRTAHVFPPQWGKSSMVVEGIHIRRVRVVISSLFIFSSSVDPFLYSSSSIAFTIS